MKNQLSRPHGPNDPPVVCKSPHPPVVPADVHFEVTVTAKNFNPPIPGTIQITAVYRAAIPGIPPFQLLQVECHEATPPGVGFVINNDVPSAPNSFSVSSTIKWLQFAAKNFGTVVATTFKEVPPIR